jgi:hypothetical protein
MKNITSVTFTPSELHLIIRAMLNPGLSIKLSAKDEDKLFILAGKFEQVLGPWHKKYRLTWEPRTKTE